ncbi:hypothetical protein D3Z60_13285 [Lachnospiraceae bacterium]|nr:hypothetical protein [Lachnospiraceae bacterium]
MKKGLLCIMTALLLILPAIPAKAAEIVEITDDNSAYDRTFTTLEGGEISTQSNGKSKVLIFFSTECLNCINSLKSVAECDWIGSGEVDVCAIESIIGTTPEAVGQFRDNYCTAAGGNIQFSSGDWQGNSVMFQYARKAGLVSTDDKVTTPIIALVDEDNKLRYVFSGNTSASEIKGKLDAMQSGPDDTEDPGETPDPGDTENPDEPENPDDTQTPGPDDTEDPDDTQTPGPDDTENPDDTQTPNPDDTEDPDGTLNPDGTQKPVIKPDKDVADKKKKDDKPSCNHVMGESAVVSDATGNSDAVAAYQCIKCGAVLKYEAVSNSAFAVFLDETAKSILNAKGSEVVIDTDIWVSFGREVFDAIKSRPDVAVTVNYVYQGKPYVLKIPAGTDVNLLMDENGFGGFRYIEHVLNTKA